MQQSTATQQWDAGLYQSRHSFVWKFGADLIELLAPQTGERILDLGCGTGQLARQIADRGASVVGIDSAPAMIEQARGSYPDLHFEVADARNFKFAQPFDAVFSNATLHWIKEADAVAHSIAHALKPGGRFVAELGGKGNVEQIHTALRAAAIAAGYAGAAELDLWYFPSVGEYATVLERHGFEVSYAAHFDRPTPLEGEEGMRQWISMFGNSFLSQIAESRREDFLRNAEEQLRPRLYRDGTWFADYRRLRVVAHKVGA